MKGITSRDILKRIVACFIIVVLASVSTFANDRSSIGNRELDRTESLARKMIVNSNLKIVNGRAKRRIVDDIENFESVGIPAERISLKKFDAKPIYSIDFGNGVVDRAIISEADDGELTIDFYEGNLHDTITVKTDGSLFFNGNEVEISVDEQAVGSEIRAEIRNADYSKKPFKGKKGDYTKRAGTYQNASIKTGKKIANTTVGAIATILAYSLGANLPGSIAVTVITSLAVDVKSAAEKYGPDSTFLSYKITKYAYKNKFPLDDYYMHSGKYYIKKNYKGYAVSHVFYEHNYFT